MDEPWFFLRIKIHVLLNRSCYLGGGGGEHEWPICGFRVVFFFLAVLVLESLPGQYRGVLQE